MQKLIWATLIRATMLTMLLSLIPQLGSAQTGEASWTTCGSCGPGGKSRWWT